MKNNKKVFVFDGNFLKELIDRMIAQEQTTLESIAGDLKVTVPTLKNHIREKHPPSFDRINKYVEYFDKYDVTFFAFFKNVKGEREE